MKRPHPAAVADQRKLALADQLELLPAARERGAGPIERAVAQHDPVRPPRAQDHLPEVADRGEGLAHLAYGRRVERVVLALHRPAGARVRAIAGHPLDHEPPHPGRLPGREQVVRALRPQPARHEHSHNQPP
jgi:hypothetical protein